MNNEKKDIKVNKTQEIVTDIKSNFSNMIENLSKNKDELEKRVKEYFEQIPKHHKYSSKNVDLVLQQAFQRNEVISNLGSFNSWTKLKNSDNEKVKITKGSKGYKVFVPIQVKDKDINGNIKLDENGKEMKKLAFKIGSVFDIEQTNAYDIGAVEKNLNYHSGGNTLDNTFYQTIKDNISKEYNLKIDDVKLPTNQGGKYLYKEDKIEINYKNSYNDKLSSLFHELGHHILHKEQLNDKDITYEQIHDNMGAREGEAESFGYVLSSAIGIKNKSELYLHSWEQDPKDMIKKMELITSNSLEAIKKINLIEVFDKEMKKEKVSEKIISKGMER
jgi:Zn-dependent peptidase ImmA (M78 family)